MKEKRNIKPNFKTLIDGTRTDFEILVNDLFNIIEIITEDVEKLKEQLTK